MTYFKNMFSQRRLALGLLLLFLCLLYSKESKAAGTLEASCVFNTAQGRCEVQNTTNARITCTLFVIGQTSRMALGRTDIRAVLNPGQSMYGFVSAVNSSVDPLIRVYGWAHCTF